MGRFSRIVLVVAGGAAFVVALSLLMIRSFFAADLIRALVDRELGVRSRAKVTVGSSHVSLALPGILVVTLEDLAVRSHSDEPLFSASSLSLTPCITRLLRGEFSITSLHVDGLRCSVVRTASGEVQAPAAALWRSPAAEASEAARAAPLPADSSLDRVSSAAPVTWSIQSVRLDRGRIDWIDRGTIAGREVSVPLREISARLDRTSVPNRFAMKGSGLLGHDESTKNLLTLEGSLFLDPGTLEPAEAAAVLSAGSLDLHACEGYLPEPLRGLKQVTARLRAEWKWSKGRGPNLSLKATLQQHAAEGTLVELDGEVSASADLNRVDRAECNVRVGSLPLNLCEQALPRWLPFRPDHGTVAADLTWTWTGPQKWLLAGELTMSHLIPTGSLEAIASSVGIDARVQLEPNRLLIDVVELSAESPLALVRGAVGAPLSERPTIDLVAEVAGDGRWIEALGIARGHALAVAGIVPLYGRIHGPLDQVNFECTGGLTWATVSVARILEKPRGKNGALTVRGQWSPGGSDGRGRSRLTSTVAAHLSGVRLLMTEELPDAGIISVHVDSTVSATDWMFAVDRLAVTAKSETDQTPLVTAVAAVRDHGSPGQFMDGTATVNVGRAVAAVLERTVGVSISGASTAKARFAARPARVEWSAELPLGPLGIGYGKMFNKPAGVEGILRAAGTWSDAGLALKHGELTLPGVSVAAHGVLRDRKSTFGGLVLELKEVDLRRLPQYAHPALTADLGGRVRGSMQKKRSDKGIVGALKLSEVTYHPRGALWTIERMDGTIEIAGDSVAVPHVVGTISGFAQGRFQVKGELRRAASIDTLDGRMSLEMGEGRIKADRLVKVLNDAHGLFGRWLQPRPIAMEQDYIEFASVHADFRIADGRAVTESFRMRGAEINTGFVGSLTLGTLDLDGVLGIHTLVAGSDTLGRIPGVRRFMDDHKELLVKMPITAFAGLRGSLAASLDVVPLQEGRMEKGIAARLHELMK